MPMEGITQPEILQAEETLRLRRFDDVFDFALDWYQDIETVKLVDGVDVPYSPEKLSGMYHYLDKHGELYFIEILEDGIFKPVGDVCMWQEDLPIVISHHYQRKGIGKRVLKLLIARAKELGWQELHVNEIYHYNIGSRRLFESVGFTLLEEKEDGNSFILKL